MREDLMEISDEDLIEKFKEGEEMAFDVLIERYENKLLNFIYRFVGNRHTAEDLYQETFLRVLKNADRYDTSYRFSTWLYRIATNLCIDHGRKKRIKNVSLDGTLQTEDGELNIYEIIPDKKQSPSEDLEKKEVEERIRCLLRALPEKYRLVLIMRHYQNFKYEEISDILNCSIGTVKSRVHYAFRCLRKLFEEGEVC